MALLNSFSCYCFILAKNKKTAKNMTNFMLKNKHYCQAAFSIKISKLLICFCIFDLSCPIHEKDTFIENLYIVLSCLIK